MKGLVAGKPERTPDTIHKSNTLGVWKGTDSLGAELTTGFAVHDVALNKLEDKIHFAIQTGDFICILNRLSRDYSLNAISAIKNYEKMPIVLNTSVKAI